jgi:uncharacterized HhH-GPD family protein
VRAPADRLHFTADDDANRMLAADPLALLIGFVLDQQVTVQKAFSSPLELQRRLGRLDAETIAGLETTELERVFAERPALHRFPGTMARRVQELCRALVSEYDGRAERVWEDADDAHDLRRRLLALPGIGDMKARSLLAVLAKRLGIELDGWDDVLPSHPTLGDVDSAQALEDYQSAKRAHKAALRAGGRRTTTEVDR